MRAVMKSVSPRICEKVANGDCTLLVSKTAPKCEVPFKCYIYCTKSTRAHVFHLYINDGIGRQNFGITGHWRSGKKVVEVNPHLPAYRYNSYLAESKVIGEFICDGIAEFESEFHDDNSTEQLRRVWYDEDDGERDAELFAEDGEPNYLCTDACLTWYELKNYVGIGDRTFYGWHISDLKIYDKPKELSEFKRPLDMPTCGYTECGSYETPLCAWLNKGCEKRIITRAPSNWQYVEEL